MNRLFRKFAPRVGVSALTVMLGIVLAGCTAQERARDWGGNATVELEKGQKLVMATWKTSANLWFLTRPMRSDETPETYTFKESAAWGVMEGTVIIKESK